MTEYMSRRIPGHFWIRVGMRWSRTFEPGHRWMYQGLIRRDAWRVGRVGIYLLRMPKVKP